MKFLALDRHMVGKCVDLFIDTFSKEPWQDVYSCRQQVVDFFENHMENNYFIGYVMADGCEIVALSLGFKKPWIDGFEYYIDQFCVSYKLQGRGVGSRFLGEIELDIKSKGLNALILNTEKSFPAHGFYLKNGFTMIDDLTILAKSI